MGFFSDLFSGGSKKEPDSGKVGSTYQGASGPGGMTGGEAFQSGVISAAERREQLLADAAAAQASGQDYSYNTDEFTGNNLGLSNTVSEGKLREGMTSPEYAKFMQTLHGNNPGAMQQAFPFSSGATARNLIKPIIGAASGLGGVAGLLPNLLSSVDKKLGGIFNQDKAPTDMGTSMSSMDQAALDALKGPSMADISGPGTAATGFDNEADAIAASGFPASEYASAPDGYQVMNANSLNNGLQFLLDQGVIDPVEGTGNLNLGNLFGSAQDGMSVLNDYNLGDFLPTEGIFSGFNEIKDGINKLDDNKGFDFNIGNKGLKYNKPLGKGNLQFSLDPNQAGIMYSLGMGA